MGNVFGRTFENDQEEILYLIKNDSDSNRKRLSELIDSSKEPFIEDASGWTPLHHASAAANLGAIEKLISKGHPFCESSVFSPLGIAAAFNKPAVIKLLIELGHPIDAQNLNGLTAIHRAAMCSSLEAISMLLEYSCSNQLSQQDRHLNTPLHLACDNNPNDEERGLQIIRLLLEKGHPAVVRNDEGAIPLHNAAMSFPKAIPLLFVHAPETIDFVDSQGNTPLHCAVLLGQEESAKQLIAFGANRLILNKNDRAPLQLDHAEFPENAHYCSCDFPKTNPKTWSWINDTHFS